MHRKNCGCREYDEVSRRNFLRLGAAAAAAVAAPAWLPRVAMARGGGPPRDVLVCIFLRGGSDGLTMCAPFGDPEYYLARPTLNIPRPDAGGPHAAINLDGFFGLPRAMQPLVDAYNDTNLLLVHATGSTAPTRSHFDAMHFMEVGKPRDPSLNTGWLGRHLATMPPLDNEAPLRSIGMSTALQRALVGSPKALPIPYPNNFELTGYWESTSERLATINAMYDTDATLLRASAMNIVNTMSMLSAINFDGYTPAGGATYPETDFGMGMRSAAALIKAQVGVEAIAIDIGGWDTHEGQEPREGYMADLMADLAGAMGAFYSDVIDAGGRADVTTVAMSEFGRVVAENDSAGTDHGHGNVMIAMGRRISGGRVLRNWPGLHPDQLFQGQDLQITIDYRDILAEIVQNRLNNPNLAAVFPSYTPTFRGVTR